MDAEIERLLQKLSPKRRLFVLAYTGEAKGNATLAARIAGYAHPGQEGHRLLKNADVAAAVSAIQAEAAEKAGVTRDEVIGFLASMMRGELQREELDVKSGCGVHLDAKLSDRNVAAKLLISTLGFAEPAKVAIEGSGLVAAMNAAARRASGDDEDAG